MFKHVKQVLAAAAFSFCMAQAATAQQGTIEILLGVPSGASGDATARLIADHMQRELGQPVIVRNHPGAGGRIVMGMLKRAEPNGNTIVFSPQSPIVTAPFQYEVDYDPIADFQPIALVATFGYAIVVNKDVPADTLDEYIELVKQEPRYRFYSSPANGSLAHMAMDRLAQETDTPLTNVSYRGTAEALVDLLGGRLSSFAANEADIVNMYRAGEVKVLATLGAERSPYLPDAPTFQELGYDIDASGWFGFYGKAGTPDQIVQRLSDAIIAATDAEEVRERLTGIGLQPAGAGADALNTRQLTDRERWGSIAAQYAPNN